MKRMLVLFLMICVSVIPVLPGSVDDVIPTQNGSNAQKLSEKELKRRDAFRKKVKLMGSGAQIRVVLRGTSDVIYQGTIDEITAEGFKLKTSDQTLPIQYGQVEKLNLKNGRYKTQGQPDPILVRQIVADMGVGESAKVKLTSNERFSGTIQSIEEESFVITSNGRSSPMKYGDVTEIEKKRLPAWAKMAIISGVVAGILAALMLAECGSGGC
jgi:ribosome maturation factor RimP